MIRFFPLGALLALAACTQIYFKDFAVDAPDRSYAARAQYEDIKRYVLERALPVTGEGADFIRFQLAADAGGGRAAPSDYLEMRLMPGEKVLLTLVRVSSGPDFSAREIEEFRQTLQSRIRERTGKAIEVRFAGEQVSPRHNVRFQ